MTHAHPDLPVEARVEMWLAFQSDPVGFLRYLEQGMANVANAQHSAHAAPWTIAAAMVGAAANTLERNTA